MGGGLFEQHLREKIVPTDSGSRSLSVISRLVGVIFLVSLFFYGDLSAAELPNRLLRMDVQKKETYTRFVFVFSSSPQYRVSYGQNREVFLTFSNTAGPPPKQNGTYGDSRVGDLRFSDRGDRLLFSFIAKEKAPGFRFLDICLPNVLTLDVGSSLRMTGAASMPSGRKEIWRGAGKLIREFDPSLPSEVPFFPTPGPVIGKLLSGDRLKLFVRGEGLLYQERGAEAQEIFSSFLNEKPLLRAIASYRLGEAEYRLQKYEAALRCFREGERLWPEFLVQSPSMVFAYADTLSRCGESSAGRKILENMIAGMTETKYGPLLLIRLADITARGSGEKDAEAIYKTVERYFPERRAAYIASLRLADRRLFSVDGNTYGVLADEYLRVYRKASDPLLKEEALFKSALITALYGPTRQALSSVTGYQKKFPTGIFAKVASTIREDLLLSRYHEFERSGDCRGLAGLVLENRAYLMGCVREESFIPRVSACFRKLGMVEEELAYFSSLADTEWAGSNKPFLYLRIHEDAWDLGRFPLAAATGEIYLKRYSAYGGTEPVRERIGWIQYSHGDMTSVVSTLSPLLKGNVKAADPASYYYLGKAYESLSDTSGASKSLERYLAALPSDTDTSLTADARIVVASLRLSMNDVKGALEMYRSGYESARGEHRDMFLYKMGEILMTEGDKAEARLCWERLLREGQDPMWKTLATQALGDMEWREKWKK